MSRRIDLQLSYLQFFSQKKSSHFNNADYIFNVKSNGILGDVAYVFNPYDQFQVLFQVGAMVLQTTNSISVNSVTYVTSADSTKIDPAGGLEFLAQLTKHIGMRMSGLYVADTQSTNSHGEMIGVVSLNYIV